MKNKIIFGIFITIIIIVVAGVLILATLGIVYSSKDSKCFEKIGKEICLEKGEEYYGLYKQSFGIGYSVKCQNDERELNDYTFIQSEREWCRSERFK